MKTPPIDATHPEPPGIDAIDRRILAELQANGRITNVDLASRTGLSPPPCLRRVRRLEEAGFIRGYHADLDPERLGWQIMFFAIVGAWPEVRECHMTRGGVDFLLRLVARDAAHENQLTERLTGLERVSRVQTLQTIRTSRALTGVPL